MKKKLCFLCVAITIICFCSSCSTSEELKTQNTQELNYCLTKFNNSIDSLNNTYNLDRTRSTSTFLHKWGRRVTTGFVDAAAGVICSEFPFVAGCATIIASGLYDDYFDAMERKMSATSQPRQVPGVGIGNFNSVIFEESNATFIDSIGYYHNMIIEEIRATEDSYVDDSLNIDFEGYYNKTIELCMAHGIYNDAMILDHSFKNTLFGYLDILIRQMAETKEGDVSTFSNIVQNSMFENFSFTNQERNQIIAVCQRIIYEDLMTDENNIVNYCRDINQIIDNSQFPTETKNTLKIANNIAINSYLRSAR